MSSLSTAPYKGTRDYYPDDMRVRNYIFRTWERVCERYGYEEYATPLLEPIEVYAAKTGQEIVNEQTYSFTDRGDRTVAIRPEMTPSISRMVAARRQELAYPARLYNIANYMRYERPQRGREREFWQLNADVFGAEGPMADAEVIQIGVDIMKEFGAKDSMYTIKVNNRKIINAMMHDYLGLDAVQAELMIKLFDRKNKISNEEFRDQAIDIFGKEAAPAGLKKIAELLLAKDISKMPKEIADNESVQEVTELFELLETKGVKNLVFDITLMRGFDYYTGTVFEFFDTHPENNRAMFGGGRYDGLVGLFGAEPLSAVGMAPGLSTTELFLASHDLMPKFHSTTEIYIVVLGENTLPGATKLAAQLREEGVNTELDITGRKLDKQIKTAVKKQIPYMLFVGEEELRKELYNFKDTNTSSEEKLSFARIVSKVKDRRKKSKDELDDFADL
ncbi:MAG TPA: histidine--tRNA ligase [Candidatus Saccharibacteria bacterium]|nr:histidine--tRNA ligase [Candidatus Saccharibacteria bacterium]